MSTESDKPSLVAYNPDRLLDVLIINYHAVNDSGLARLIEVSPPVISKIRCRRAAVGAALLIRLHETFDIDIADLRCLMGDRRKKFRV